MKPSSMKDEVPGKYLQEVGPLLLAVEMKQSGIIEVNLLALRKHETIVHFG